MLSEVAFLRNGHRPPGRGRKGGRPLARHAPHVRGAPGAKPFVDDLLLGRGFVRSRAAPKKKERKKKKLKTFKTYYMVIAI